jgi:hypothetical protein
MKKIAIFAAVRKGPGQRWRAVTTLGAGGVTPGTSLVVEPLTGRDGRRGGTEWIAGGVGLLCSDGHGERGQRTSNDRESACVHCPACITGESKLTSRAARGY